MSKNLSAVKRVQIASRNSLINKKYKSSIKTMIKKTLHSILKLHEDSSNVDQVYYYLSESYSKIDKAVKKGVIPKNKGARKKAMLSKKLRKY